MLPLTSITQIRCTTVGLEPTTPITLMVKALWPLSYAVHFKTYIWMPFLVKVKV